MFSFIISVLALLIILIAMVARANDLRWKEGLIWQVRLIGFVLTGCTTIGIIGSEFISGRSPTIYDLLFRVGVAFVLLTTPGLPPFWKNLWNMHLMEEEKHGDIR